MKAVFSPAAESRRPGRVALMIFLPAIILPVDFFRKSAELKTS
jgi:hypothetical protein